MSLKYIIYTLPILWSVALVHSRVFSVKRVTSEQSVGPPVLGYFSPLLMLAFDMSRAAGSVPVVMGNI